MKYILEVLVSILVQMPMKSNELSVTPAAIPVVKAYSTAEVPSTINELLTATSATKGALGYSQKGRVIEAWYFPGISSKKALVIGGSAWLRALIDRSSPGSDKAFAT